MKRNRRRVLVYIAEEQGNIQNENCHCDERSTYLVTEELEDHQQKWSTKFKMNEIFFMQNSRPGALTDIGLAKRLRMQKAVTR